MQRTWSVGVWSAWIGALLQLAVCTAASDSGGGGAVQSGDKAHPGWLIGSWHYADTGDSYGVSTDENLILNADGSYVRTEYFCSVSGCKDRGAVESGVWTGSDTKLTLGDKTYEHKTTPNCRIIAVRDKLWSGGGEGGCPFDSPALTDAERCLVGRFVRASGNSTIEYELDEDRTYRYKNHHQGYSSTVSYTETSFGYWQLDGNTLVRQHPLMDEPVREAVLMEEGDKHVSMGDHTYDHYVEDDACDIGALLAACECKSGQTGCQDDGTLLSCDGCTFTATACATLCKDEGYDISDGCGYDPEQETNACACRMKAPPEPVCDCSDGESDCVDDSTLRLCSDGCNWDSVDCAAACAQDGWDHAEGCGWDDETSANVCWCANESACECKAGDTECAEGPTLNYCTDGCNWDHLDCEQLCRQNDWDHTDGCGWSDESNENVCFCVNDV